MCILPKLYFVSEKKKEIYILKQNVGGRRCVSDRGKIVQMNVCLVMDLNLDKEPAECVDKV